MGWKSTIDITRDEAIRLIKSKLSEIKKQIDECDLHLSSENSLIDLNKKIKVYFDNGLDFLCVDVYDDFLDGKITSLLEKTLINTQYRINRKYLEFNNIVNRNNIYIKDLTVNKHSPCYLPSYKLFIDIEGDVLLCANDWTREEKFGNIYDQDLETIWLKNMNERRMKLINGDRSINSCKNCDIKGDIYGKESAIQFQRY